MYKDPSEFRERFKAYKEGKSVREIYGLPGYAGGKATPLDDTLEFLKLYEGFKDTTYLDGNGIPTIGYGFTDSALVNKGKITRAEADSRLRQEVLKREAVLSRMKNWDKLSEESKTALRSYYYNYPAGFKDTTKFMKYWNSGLYSKAIKEVDAGMYDEKNPGLRTRRLAEQALLRNDPFLMLRTPVVSEKPRDVTVQYPDVTRVATTIPQEKVIDYTDRRNTVGAEIDRSIWAHNIMNNIQGMAYDVPIWESKSLPALEPIDLDVTPFKTYGDGKLPGYQRGKNAEIKQGPKPSPARLFYNEYLVPKKEDSSFMSALRKAGRSVYDLGEDIAYVTGIKDILDIAENKGHKENYINLGVGAATGAGAKAITKAVKSAKVVKAAKKTIKPPKNSAKFDTNDPNIVGKYYTEHPEEVTPMTDSLELNTVVDFLNNHVGPKYAKQNGVHVGINPKDINLGYADFSGTKLGGYVGPSGEVVINKDILNDPKTLLYVLGHEIGGHWFDKHYPLTASQMSVVGYGMPFDQAFLNERPWMNAIAEANAERRAFELMNYFDKGVVGNDLDNAIKGMPMAEAKRYIDRLGYSRGINWLWPDLLPFKQAVTSVPTAGAGIYLAGNEYKNGKLPGYKNGKIYIKPANRGKFNATKKRTGKTTEELTHSKNPLTRKRAIFAQNAKKWKH